MHAERRHGDDAEAINDQHGVLDDAVALDRDESLRRNVHLQTCGGAELMRRLSATLALILAAPAFAQQAPSTIPQMQSASTPLSGSELLYVSQGGQPRKTTVGSLSFSAINNLLSSSNLWSGTNNFTGPVTVNGALTATGAVGLSGVQPANAPNLAAPANNGGTAIRLVESGGNNSTSIGPGVPGIYGDYTNPATYQKRFLSGNVQSLTNAGVVTNAVNNGSGLCRLSVSNTSYMTTGDTVTVSNITGATGCNGNFTINVVSSGVVDLVGSTFGGSYTNTVAGSFTPNQAYKITSLGTTNFTAIGSPANAVGQWFIATGAGSGTGTASSAQIVGVTTAGTTPINLGTMAFVQNSPPDNGGDTSVLYAFQAGGGNVLSLYNLCETNQGASTSYCNYGRALEIGVDGSKDGITINNTGIGSGGATGRAIWMLPGDRQTGLLYQPIDDNSPTDRAIDVITSGNTAEKFYVQKNGNSYVGGSLTVQGATTLTGSVGLPAGQMGSLVNNFGGLQFAIAQGSIGNPSGTMSGYVGGDSITLQCSGVTFAVAPVIGAVGVSGGVVTQTIVANPGVTSGTVPSGVVNCSQASTSGSGTGFQVTAQLGVIAAYVSMPSLSQGGSAASNENFFLNYAIGNNTSFSIAGAENFFAAPNAGFGFTGGSYENVSLGVSSCGPYGSPVASSNNVCIGVDAARNVTGNFSQGNNVIIGQGSFRNGAGGYNVWVGGSAAGSGGTNSTGLVGGLGNTGVGYGVAPNMNNGSGNTFLGVKSGTGIVNGNNNIIIQATNGADACGNGEESNVIAVCAGAGRIWTTTGTGSPSSSKTLLAGTAGTGGHTIAGLPTCNSGMAGQFDFVTNGVASPTYMGTVSTTGAANDPVFCNGSAWVYH
jgi:hypothetical protein